MPGSRRSATASQCARGLLTTYCQQHDGVCRAGRGGHDEAMPADIRPNATRVRRRAVGGPHRRAPRADAGRSRRCVRRRAGRCGAPTACRPDARIRSGARRWRRSRPIRVCVRIRGGHRIEARARARRGLARSRRRDAGVGIECVADAPGAARAGRIGGAVIRGRSISAAMRSGGIRRSARDFAAVFRPAAKTRAGCLLSSRPWATRYV